MLNEIMDDMVALVMRKLNVASLNAYDDARLREDIIPDCAAMLALDLGMTADEALRFDWSRPSRERSLLVNLCFYEWNHAQEQFAGDYADAVAKCRDVRLSAQARRCEGARHAQ